MGENVIQLTFHKRAAVPEKNVVSQYIHRAVKENCADIGYFFFATLSIQQVICVLHFYPITGSGMFMVVGLAGWELGTAPSAPFPACSKAGSLSISHCLSLHSETSRHFPSIYI